MDVRVDARAELDVKDSDSSIQEKNVWEEEQRWGSVRTVTPPPSSASIYLCLFIFVGLYS